MIKVSLLDSGEFVNVIGLSAPRLYGPIRELEALGELKIQDISYVKSPIRGEPLPEEGKSLFRIRNETRQEAEEERVRATAMNYRLDPPKNTLDPDALQPVVCLNQRPGETRDDILKLLLKHQNVQRIILSPPHFLSVEELSEYIELDTERKIVAWVPYRYALGIAFVKRKFPKADIAAGTLRVVCAPYPQTEFLSEFCLPFTDAFLSITGGITKNPHVEHVSTAGLSVFSVTATHENDVVSSILFSTAGGSFQNFDHCDLAILSLKMESIELSNSLCTYRHHSPVEHTDSGLASHDTIRSNRNGTRDLLRASLSLDEDKDNQALDDGDRDNQPLPTLSTLIHTQALLDTLLKSVTDADA